MFEPISYRHPSTAMLGALLLLVACSCLLEPARASDRFRDSREQMIRLIEADVRYTSEYLKQSSLDSLVLDAMASGALSEGDRLPSVRKLAATTMVNANTVAKAYRDLEALAAVRGENGRGVFVTEVAERVATAARRDVTLDRFRRASREALRAGHTLASTVSPNTSPNHMTMPCGVRVKAISPMPIDVLMMVSKR